MPHGQNNLQQSQPSRRLSLGSRTAAAPQSPSPIPLLLVLEDDVALGDPTEFALKIGQLPDALQTEDFDAVDLLSPDLSMCKSSSLLRQSSKNEVPSAAAHLTRPLLATSRAHGILWSLQGVRKMLDNLPCGLAYDLYFRHLMRIRKLDMLNSCDGLVVHKGWHSVKDP